jgi:hypothetical protein
VVERENEKKRFTPDRRYDRMVLSNQLRFDITKEIQMSEKNAEVVNPVVVSPRDITAVAAVAVKVSPSYKVRAQKAKTFVNLTLVEDEKVNWKKGLIFLITRYSKGVNFELWMYSTKKGAHLSEFNDQVSALADESVKCEALGLAKKLRLQLADTLSDDAVEAAIEKFMSRIEPTLNEIRGKVTVVVSEKKTPKAKKVAAPAETPASVPANDPAPDANGNVTIGEPSKAKSKGKKAK